MIALLPEHQVQISYTFGFVGEINGFGKAYFIKISTHISIDQISLLDIVPNP
jgi:hypothetical protein